MQINYFALPIDDELEDNLFWPIQVLTAKRRNRRIRIYYIQSQQSQEMNVKFFCLRSDTEVPDTFPGRYFASVFPRQLPDDPPANGDKDQLADDALHLFMATPVNQPKKPIVVNVPSESGDNGAGGANGEER